MKRRNHLAAAAAATVVAAAWASVGTAHDVAPSAGRPDVAVPQAHPGVGPFADLQAWRMREATASYWREVGHNMQPIVSRRHCITPLLPYTGPRCVLSQVSSAAVVDLR